MRNRRNILGFVLLTLAAAMGVVGSGPGAQAQSPGAPATQKTGGEAVGAAVVHPAGWNVEREPYTYDDTYGYTLWHSDTDEAHDHGGKPALRVALAYEMEPQDIEGEVRRTIANYADLDMKRETVRVAREHKGVAVGPIPGSTPYTAVYVPVNGRAYKINVYAEKPGEEGLGGEDRALLSELRFNPPSRSVGSLDLPQANDPETLYPKPGDVPEETTKYPEGAQGIFPARSLESNATTARGGSETRIEGGCWGADPDFYVQTIHGYKANSNVDDDTTNREDRIPTGWSRIGVPNFWGQYTHGNLGYGKCNEPNWTNDQYAVDYPLNRGDAVFSPFDCGKVTFRGRNDTHYDYGIFVVIKACNGKYVSLQAHLNDVRKGLSRGDRVDRDKVIGYAGDSEGSVDAGRVHVHQAYYRYPTLHQDGSPYGGAGLRVDRLRYFGHAARRKGFRVKSHTYDYQRVNPDYGAFCREGRSCGEGYLVSN